MSQYLTDTEFIDLAVEADLLDRSSEAERLVQINSASDFANSYFRAAGYDPELVTIDQDIKWNIAAVAAYRLAKKLQLLPNPVDESALWLDYQQALKWFEKVQRGEVKPSVTDQTPTEEPNTGVMLDSKPQRGW